MNDPSINRTDRALAALTRTAHRAPWRVLACVLAALALTWAYASRLEVRGDFLELLPTESEGARLFRATLARMGGGSSTMKVVVESPDAAANQRIVDALAPRLRALPRSRVRTVETGPDETRRFYLQRRWLFADVGDLEETECELARARRRAVPGFVDLDDSPCSEARSDRGAPPADAPAANAPTPAPAAPDASPLARFRARLTGRLRDADRFPTGYFRNESGTLYAIVLRAPGTGTGDRNGDLVMARVQQIVRDLHPERFHPQAVVGLGGDIPTAIAEREALVNDVALSSGLAIALILGAIAVFFRSLVSIAHVGFAMFTGLGAAFAVAMAAFGYLNASTAFLSSIIAGNGINYGILYLTRYRERRGLGDSVEGALLDAVRTCRVGTQVASLAAAGAYGSLMFTSFRGFSQFGLIGGVGMLACWCATMVALPATVTLWERVRARFGRDAATMTRAVRAPAADAIGAITQRAPRRVLALGFALTLVAAAKLPTYLRDPWEYNFGKLGSRHSRQTGASRWNLKSDQIFTARGGSPDMLLADSMEEVLPLAASLVARDRATTGGRYVERVETVYDRLGGPPALVARKLALLAQIRDHLDAVRDHLNAEDQRLAREWRPPESLRPIDPSELPSLVREQFTERDGRFGTPFFVYYRAWFTPSDGRRLMEVARLTSRLRMPDGRVVPTVSRATVFAEMVSSMGRDGPRATLLAFLSVVVIVVLATRRARPAAAVLGSLLSGVLLTVGGAAWLGVRLNFLNFVALPLTFGIGVEYAVNLYDRIEHERGDVREAVRSVGGAVFLCSLTTIIGYGALLAADNQALQSFGWYAMAGELACIVTALLLMPSALRLLRR
jgi:predicted exporter